MYLSHGVIYWVGFYSKVYLLKKNIVKAMKRMRKGRYINNDNENGNVLYWSLKMTNQVNDVAVYQSNEKMFFFIHIHSDELCA